MGEQQAQRGVIIYPIGISQSGNTTPEAMPSSGKNSKNELTVMGDQATRRPNMMCPICGLRLSAVSIVQLFGWLQKPNTTPEAIAVERQKEQQKCPPVRPIQKSRPTYVTVNDATAFLRTRH